MINLKEKLIQAMLEEDPSLDLSPGSNLRDLVVNPLSSLLEGYESTMQQIERSVNLVNPELMSDEQMDGIAANYLITRNLGVSSTGQIVLSFRQPQAIQIPAGTTFRRGQLLYRATQTVSISRLGFTQVGDLYNSPSITVIAAATGPEYSLRQGDQLQLQTQLAVSPTRIQVTAAFSEGVARETNSQLYSRIKASVYNNSLASPQALAEKIKAEFPAVTKVRVVGAGDPHMLRDLSPAATGYEIKEDFKFVNSGQALDPYARGHIAFVDNFTPIEDLELQVVDGDLQIVSGVIQLPPPDQWNTEFSNEMYRGLSKEDNGLVAENDPYAILDLLSLDPTTRALDVFTLSDSLSTDNELVRPREIQYKNGEFLLGYIPEEELEGAQNQLVVGIDEFQQQVIDALDGASSAAEVYLAQTQLLGYANQRVNSFSPVMHRNITQHTGIIIEFEALTTDQTEMGQMCYATVLRNSEFGVAHDGYGLAYRKQPNWLIRIDEDNYTDLDLRAEDYARFEEDFGISVAAAGVAGQLSNPVNSQYWMYNVYLVDNDILSDKTYIGRTGIADFIGGKNQFLQAGKKWIVPDQEYNFKIQIYPTLATKIWVSSSADYGSPVIDRGATYPPYLPVSGQKILNLQTGLEELDVTKGHFGIGVSQTEGYQWKISDILIRSFTLTFPVQQYNFTVDPAQWNGGQDPLKVEWIGYGHDPDITTQGAAAVFLWNPTLEEWESVGEQLAAIGDPLADKKVEKTFYYLNDYLHQVNGRPSVTVAAIAKNFGLGFEQARNHFLATHYCSIKNPNALRQNRYNAVDVYCYSPSELVELLNQYTVDPISRKVTLEIPFFVDLIEVREAISDVVIPASEYTIYNPLAGETGGPLHQVDLFFKQDWAGAQITVLYKAWVQGAATQAFIDNPETRYPAMSIQAKAYPITRVQIDKLEYTGVVGEEEVKQALISYINSLGLVMEKSDLVNLLYSLGASYVDLDIEISFIEYDSQGTRREKEFTGQRYQIGDKITQFYTSLEFLDGVVNV